MDAVQTYFSHGADRGALDRLFEQERILFCCQSRLMATLWVRSERGCYTNQNLLPEHVVGSCTTIAEALSVCRQHNPTLLVATQQLEQGSGLDLIIEAKRIQPELRTLLFLRYEHRTLIEEAIKTHSDGIVLESEMGSGHVIAALRTVSNGGLYLEPKIARQLHGSARGQDPGLSWRERQIMQEVANGRNDREIGIHLHLATDTVKYHLRHVYDKLKLHNRTRAAITLVLLGLINPPVLLASHQPENH